MINTIEIKTKVTVEMKETDISNTSRMGYLPKVSYCDVEDVFGEPQYTEEGDKVTCEWIGKINGSVFTIYDYKSPVKYIKNKDWHIGARNKETADLVIAYFEAVLPETKVR